MMQSSWESYVKAVEDGAERKVFDPEDRPYANTVIQSDGSSLHVIFWFPPDLKLTKHTQYATVAHEALHGVLAVLNSRGIQINAEHDEAATYYLGWLMGEITTRLKEKKHG